MAAEFGLNEATVRKAVRLGELPHTRIGRTIVFDRELVRKALVEQMVRNAPAAI